MLAYFKPYIHQCEGVTASTDSKSTTETSSEVGPDAKAGVSCKKRKLRSYIGVINKRQKFVAQIYTNDEQKELGTYDTPEEAAHAFDCAVLERKLPTSLLNYPATGNKKALTAASSANAQKSKFVKHPVAHYDELIDLTSLVDQVAAPSVVSSSDELIDLTSLVDQVVAPSVVSSSDKAVSALSALAIVTQQSKPKKKTESANNENGRPELSAQGMRNLVEFYGGRIRCRDLVNAYSHKFTPLDVRLNMGQSIITIDDNDENGKCFQQLVRNLLRLRKRSRVLYYELREQPKVDVTAKKRGPRTKNVNGSTDDEKRKSFAEWHKECVTPGNRRSGRQPSFKANVVYQHYQQWCIQRNKPWMSSKGTLNFKAEMNKTDTPWYKHTDGSRYYHPIASIEGYKPSAPAPCFKEFLARNVSITPCDGRCKDNRHTRCPRVAKLQLNTKHSKSWLNYCKQHGLPEGKLKPTKFKADFHAKLREAMGDLFQESSRHRGELCYDHIEFKVD